MAPRFATRADFHAWLEARGLAHVGRLNLEAVAPFVDERHWSRLRVLGARRRLSDLASAEGVAAAREWLDAALREELPAAVERFVDAEEAAATLARTQLDERLAPPVEPRARALHARLLELRRRVPTQIAPRPTATLDVEQLDFDRTLPGFRFKDLLPTELPLRAGGGFGRPTVRLALSDGATKLDCACLASHCVHALAALDTALVAVQRGLDEKVLAELSRPAWARTLAALDAAFDAQPETPPVATTQLTFRLAVTKEDEVSITAWAGDERCSRAELLRGGVAPGEAPLVALLPEDGAPASRALLEGLIGHPRLVVARDPSLAATIERAPVGIVAEERGPSVRLTIGLEGAPFPPWLFERVRQAKDDALLFLWDEGPRRLTLLDVRPEVRRLLALLGNHTDFPPEAHAALLTSLSKWARVMPVAMPRSVMGESVPPQLAPVLRLEARASGIVEVELRIRPIADAPALQPGVGPRDVHLRRGDKPFHSVRDLRAEQAFAEQLVAELPFSRAEPSVVHPFLYSFERPEDVFELLDACARRAIPPELEWVGTPLRNLGATGPRALRVTVQHHLEWFGVLGELHVKGERVELARLVEAGRRRARYVQVSTHGWIELNELLRRHLEKVAAHAHVTRQGVRVGPAAISALQALAEAGAELEGDAQWKQLAARVTAARTLELPLPAGLKTSLRPYQREGYEWLLRLAAWGAGGVLADDMGLGKTVQALAVLLARAELGPALVVAPTSVAFNWVDEAARFAPSLRLLVYSEAKDRELSLDQLGPGDVLVVSYGLLLRDAQRLAARAFATAVFDEAQQLKNAQTQRAHAAKAIRADFRFALSGTPLENHLGELWSLFSILFPTLLGSWESFRDRFAIPIEKNIDPNAPAALAQVLEPFLLRRTKAEVEHELPARTEVRVPVVLSAAEWQLYEDTRLAALSDLETPKRELKEQERRVQVLAMLTRLRLAASHPRLLEPSAAPASSKLLRLLELLDELRAEGQQVLVFSQFTSHLALVAEALRERRIDFVELDGSTPAAERRERVRKFQDGGVPVFLLSIKAGGVGLNLTASSNVIILDPWWNPAVEDQAADRAHRLGQTRPVTIYRLIARDTVEELMLSLHEKKRALIERVLTGKGRASKIGTDELLALFNREA
ncbi:MAG: SNF2-related protein [Myxococcota bacterium]